MLSQRLVPRLCQNCKKVEKPSLEIQNVIKKTLEKMPQAPQPPYEIYHSPGCSQCNGKGVSGRIALFEVLQMTPELEEVINTSPTEIKIIKEAERQGIVTLRQDGILKALEGIVSIETVLKETGEI